RRPDRAQLDLRSHGGGVHRSDRFPELSRFGGGHRHDGRPSGQVCAQARRIRRRWTPNLPRSGAMAALKPMNNRREPPEAPYLAAAGGRKPSRVPVWFMRQAGRSLPEYRALRAKNTMMQACFDAELITEITMQPVRRHGVDAAILFSDIVVPLRAAGVDVDIVPDVGRVIAEPIRTAAGVTSLTPLDRDAVAPVA